MYLSFYNLKVKPFQMSTDPAFLWLGEKHREALAVLKYAILENKGVLALTGDVGTGKTTLINALLKSLGEDTITATIYDPRLELLDFFNTVAAAFQIKKTFKGKGEFVLQFMDFLNKANEQNQKVLLIIDEAQGINEALLEEIRLLSNLEAKYTRLLNIFFVGQNEFIDILQKYENRALRQRVTIRYHIDPLTLNETAAYIKYRLDVAGTQAPIFDSGAIDEIYFFSSGYPRLINIMCDHALLSGYVREAQVIKADLIRECREELLVSKKTSENDFQHPGNNYQSPPSEPVFTEPPESQFTPVEDNDIQEDPQMVFGLSKPESAPGKPKKSSKKRFFRSPVAVAFLLIVGIAAGYFFYSGDRDTVESFATSAQQKARKYFSVEEGSENDEPPTAPVQPERSDIPGGVEAEKAGDSGFFIAKSPNSNSVKETIPNEAETPQAAPLKKVPEDNGTQPDTTKPDDTMPSSPEKKVPVISPITVKKPDKIQTLISEPVQGDKEPKTPETKTTKTAGPVEKPETDKPVTKPVQAEKKTSERYQAKSEVKQRKEPESSKKKATAPAATPSVKTPKETVVPKKDLSGTNKVVSRERAQPARPVPDEKKVVSRVDKNAVSSSSPAGKTGFTQFNLHSRLNAFLNEYCQTYEQKDLDKFSTYFASNAVEKGKPFRSWLSRYRQNFDRIDSIEYDIELQRYATQEELGLVKVDGTFHVRAKLAGSKEWRKNSGQISMVLEADGNSFKVRQLDY